MRAGPVVGAVLMVAAMTAACGRSAGDAAGGTTTGSTPHSTSLSPKSAPGASASSAPSTPALDSIVVLGHSGTTGYGSDPAHPPADVRENSWATGGNPHVNSIGRRLLATHPALEGHAASLGVDGSTVDDLPTQVDQMLALRPLPDVVIIQSIDNDIKCDGTDPANEKTYATKLGAVLTRINENDRYAQIFFVDQWSSVAAYVDATKDRAASVSSASGDGPCDTFTVAGKVRPAGIASQQKIVDDYFDVITRVCAAHRACFTDDGALQKMPLHSGDLTADADHLSVQGLAVMAQYAWNALPAAIKSRP